MLLRELTITDFINETGSNSPAPGGGSIAALSAASAAALIEMVTNLTIGKKGYEEVQAEMEMIKNKAVTLKESFVGYIDKDSIAFNQIMAAFKLPKSTSNEKELRTIAVQAALKTAAIVPFEIGKNAYDLLDLAESVVLRGNKSAVTDGAVAAMSARTAVHSAFYNTKINLGSIKDQEFVNTMAADMDSIESKVDLMEQAILQQVHL